MTADDPMKPLRKQKRRRQFLTLLGIGSGGLGGYWYASGELPVIGDTQFVDSVDRALSGDITDYHWEGATLVVEFAEDTNGQKYAVTHEYNDPEDAELMDDIPQFGGVVEIDFRSFIDTLDDYPTGRFTLGVYTGEDGGVVFFIEDEISSVTIDVPENELPGTPGSS